MENKIKPLIDLSHLPDEPETPKIKNNKSEEEPKKRKKKSVNKKSFDWCTKHND